MKEGREGKEGMIASYDVLYLETLTTSMAGEE